MQKQRIQVYADPETKRRIELAAAKYDIPVTEYCLSAIRQQLADDDLLEQERIEIDVVPSKPDGGLLADLSALHEQILARRGGRPLEIDVLGQIREERLDELTGLR